VRRCRLRPDWARAGDDENENAIQKERATMGENAKVCRLILAIAVLAAVSLVPGAVALAGGPNDLCTDAIPIGVPSLISSTTAGATADGAPFCGTSQTAPGIWYSVVGTGNTITATTCTSFFGYDTKVSVYCGRAK